jgi:hypothetical protein
MAIRQGTNLRRFQETQQSSEQQQGKGKHQTGILMDKCSSDGGVANCNLQMDCLEINF